jgi:hypothetical protein
MTLPVDPQGLSGSLHVIAKRMRGLEAAFGRGPPMTEIAQNQARQTPRDAVTARNEGAEGYPRLVGQIDAQTAAARRVFAAQKCFRPFSDYATGECWVHPATLQAMREAEAAFAAAEYDRAEHLADVVLAMMRRDTIKFSADRKGWITRMRGDHA